MTFTFSLLNASKYPSIWERLEPLTCKTIKLAAWLGPKLGLALIRPAIWDLPTLSALFKTCPSLPILYSKNSFTLIPRLLGVDTFTIGTPVLDLSSFVLCFEFGSKIRLLANSSVVWMIKNSIAIAFLKNLFLTFIFNITYPPSLFFIYI